MAAYGVFSHRHGAEIQQELGIEVTFVPHLVPLDRGILETIYARLQPGVDADTIERTLTAAYAGSPFVRLTGSELPEIKHVAHTNYCDIGWRVDRPGGQVVIVSCIDNLVKGAAGQAIQNFNVAFGFDEELGLS
jgi:N-acetyl-gamma-glutamyl-phosphate reductase